MNVAFIPVRGGSKSIPFKNIKLLNGKPLVYWTLYAACKCRYIDKVYVATDSVEIYRVVEGLKDELEEEIIEKLQVIERSTESATDTASTEYAMLEFASNYIFDNIVLIQATSPLLSCRDLEKGFEIFLEPDVDGVLSVVRQKRFIWENDSNGFARAVNYEISRRPRRQEFNGYFVENGAFYISSKHGLLKSGNRVSGNIKVVEMDSDTYFEIDEPSDWIIIESLMKNRENMMDNRIRLPEIKMFLTDCDGCLTDGGMYYSEKGDELKKFNTRDGLGFALLKKNGIITGIITGENMELNQKRAEKLKLDILQSGCHNKVECIKMLCKQYKIAPENVAYVGDDMNDFEAISFVGFGCCPTDACSRVKKIAKHITNAKGGEGVIREIVDYMLKNKMFC